MKLGDLVTLVTDRISIRVALQHESLDQIEHEIGTGLISVRTSGDPRQSRGFYGDGPLLITERARDAS